MFDEKNHHIENAKTNDKTNDDNDETFLTFVDAMAKRPRRSEGGPSSSAFAAAKANPTKGKIDDDAIEKRQAECRGMLEALNNQFYAHVAEQKRKNPIKSWAEGCQDYVKHLRKLMVRAYLTLSLHTAH